MKEVVWFYDIHKDDIPIVGGKGANLGEMTNANFPVPNGFAVTAQAYFSFLEESGLKNEIVSKIDSLDVENTEELEKTTAEVREKIKKAKLPQYLTGEIIKAYSQLGGKERLAWLTSSQPSYVAVRSSATAEDLPEASFAGQQDTYLNIIGKENLLKAILSCFASLFTARAVYYRKKQGFSTEKVGISVIVQKMVNSEASGIMFTADPTGDETKIVIEAGFGLGEAIVSGSITPDNYVVDKSSMKIIRKKINKQTFAIIREGNKNVQKELEPKRAMAQKMTDKSILELAHIGRKIETHYGKPQDIEWAVEKGNLMIVQSRPITTLGLKDKVGNVEKMQKVDATVLLQGGAGSPGVIIGKVKVVPKIEDIAKIEKGDILVTAMTSPDWVPVMKKSSAIITNEGGRTCHAAIVSRELGIPCVVGTSNATELLKDGEIVTVNGYTGDVYKGEVKIKEPEKQLEKIIQKEELDTFEQVIKDSEKIDTEELKHSQAVEDLAEDIRTENEQIQREKEEKIKLIDMAKKEAEKILEKYGEKPTTDLSEQEIEKEKDLIENLLKKVSAKVKVNVALPDVAEKAANTNADGVGLLRAEHMITSGGMHPAEYLRENKYDELVARVKNGIKIVATNFENKPVWFRTFDARTDEFRELKGGDKEPKEDNPMIGWHGIRRDLDEPMQLKAQFQAIKELRDEGIKNVGIMLPFVISVNELKKAKEIAKETGLNPDEQGLDFGIMVETPASVWIIDELIDEGINFVSFGTNDLTQLTLGLDRNNERIQKHFTELHPAILKSIEHVISKCKSKGVQTSICGQAASNPDMVKHLIRYGISSVSANIDAVEEIKNTVLVEEKKLLMNKLEELKK